MRYNPSIKWTGGGKNDCERLGTLLQPGILRMADESGINEKLFAQADEKIKNRSVPDFQKLYEGELLPPDFSK